MLVFQGRSVIIQLLGESGIFYYLYNRDHRLFLF